MPKKIIFMGTPLFAVPILKSLYQNGYEIATVYTQPPQKSHRGQKINKSVGRPRGAPSAGGSGGRELTPKS